MNILFVVTDYLQNGKAPSGFNMYIYRVTKALKEKGHQSVILTLGKGNGKRIYEDIEVYSIKAKEISFENSNVNRIVNNLLHSFYLNKKIGEIISERQIDIIQFTSLEGIAFFYCRKIPAVMRLSSYAKIAYSSYTTLSKREVAVLSMVERIASKRCNAVFAPCLNTAEAFSEDIKRKVSVIETPFINDVKEYDYSIVDIILFNKKYVLFFGTLYAEKGILVIADILSDFLEENKNYYFVFAGKPTIINGKNIITTLREKAGKYADRVIILPALAHNKLYPVIMNAYLVVLPSLMENFSNACIEAMYFSKIVIGTRGASFEQLIENGTSGFLCEIGDSDSLLQAINKATCLSENEKKTIEKNAHNVVKRLSPDIVVQRLIRYYEYIIKYQKERKGNER